MKNWYKLAQQQQMLSFYDDVEQSEMPTPQELLDAPKTPDLLNDILENCNSYHEILNALKLNGFTYEEIQLNNNKFITVPIQNDTYFIDDFDSPEAVEIKKWIENLYEHELDAYIPPEEDVDFWSSNDRPSKVYHATTEENAEQILQKGLMIKNNSRGISNRGTPAAVFTSDNVDDISSYGNVIFEIDVDQMFADGYTPYTAQETPVEETSRKQSLAWKLGLRDYEPSNDYSTEGIYDSTFIFYGAIPLKYIRLID